MNQYAGHTDCIHISILAHSYYNTDHLLFKPLCRRLCGYCTLLPFDHGEANTFGYQPKLIEKVIAFKFSTKTDRKSNCTQI